jgi:hypothetical protein
MITIKQVQHAFQLLHETARQKEFSKAMYFNWWSEKDLLPSVRFYLLGYFGAIDPEVKTELISGNITGEGYIDFAIENIAVEFAVRRPNDYRFKLRAYLNIDERRKLIRRKVYNEHLTNGVLVLFDFANDPLSIEQLEDYREMPSLGQGNFKKDDFSILYFYTGENSETICIRKNIKAI